MPCGMVVIRSSSIGLFLPGVGLIPIYLMSYQTGALGEQLTLLRGLHAFRKNPRLCYANTKAKSPIIGTSV
jgi:hypothetical protein